MKVKVIEQKTIKHYQLKSILYKIRPYLTLTRLEFLRVDFSGMVGQFEGRGSAYFKKN